MFYWFLVMANFLASAMALALSSFWSVWIIMELMNFIFGSLMLMNSSSMIIKSKCFIFFMSQSLISSLFIFSYLCSLSKPYFYWIMFFSMLAKMSVFPFQSWFLNICENMKWENFFLLSTTMKIPPLMVLLKMAAAINSTFAVFFVVGSTLAIPGLWKSSSRLMLAYSSVSHMSWLMLCMIVSEKITITYFLTYAVLVWVSCMIFKEKKICTLSSIATSNDCFFVVGFVLLSFMGMPPFLGFFPKLFCIYGLLNQQIFIETMVLLFISVVVMFLYMKFMIIGYMSKKDFIHSFELSKKNNKNHMLMMMLFLMLSPITGFIAFFV